MNIKTIPCGPLSTNSYLIHDQKQALLIDPAEFLPLWNQLKQEKLELSAILLTHGHFDHILALPELRKTLPEVPIYIHAEDADLLYDGMLNGSSTFIGSCALPSTEKVNHYESTLSTPLGEISIFPAPGHTPGSVVLGLNDHMFTGDFIFKESIGRTDFSRGSARDIHESLKRFIRRFYHQAESIMLYPGHGENTTLAHELQFNPFLDRMTKHMGQ